MPVINKVSTKRETLKNQSGRKAPGTRLGTVVDWRGDAENSEKISGRRRHVIRDGR